MTAQTFLDGRITLYHGDCLRVLRKLPDNSVDSAVMDPPYHLSSVVKRFGSENAAPAKSGATGAFKRASAGFMGKKWDGGDIAFRPAVWKQVYRVLKPGGYLIAFASSRGYGRMQVAIEKAGFDTHPMFAWIFGQGFPKATRIKAEGYDGFRYGKQSTKPAMEPIYMGQKPFSEENGTANILKWGTGAVNIDACRVGTEDEMREGASKLWSHYREGEASAERRYTDEGGTNFAMKPGPRGGSPDGRWPANVIHDGSDEVMASFPSTVSGSRAEGEYGLIGSTVYNPVGTRPMPAVEGDAGSAARFFYTAKADAEDRIGSKHPTVKPLDLVQYLVRFVTPPRGVVLDCFAGTGTTGEAAWRENMRAILIEKDPESIADIVARIDLMQKPTKRAAVAKTKGKLMGAEGTPLFGDLPA